MELAGCLPGEGERREAENDRDAIEGRKGARAARDRGRAADRDDDQQRIAGEKPGSERLPRIAAASAIEVTAPTREVDSDGQAIDAEQGRGEE